MRIDIITVLPELIQSPFNHSIVKRACDKKLVEIYIHDLRNYGLGKHKQVDDYSYGGDAGMVLMIEPIYNIITTLTAERSYNAVVYTSPDGVPWTQKTANRFSTFENLLILCGHYKGIDHRIREHLVTHEYSVGDYVLTGGELAAAVFVDSIVRLIPGAISDEQSALSDSFQDDLLAPPVYTRPAEFNGWTVPDVLLSGNTAEVEKWKEQQSMERTLKLRPGLLDV
ncbi:MAG TPA: tRNA (guanosine(37)-N1)-methyltransferase TrmD [Bacteroidales bacterium]|nr:tRNA (guanosine(37)-N1)-methyltransferase TrmD [Bacteroidales bacterium]